jgi:hypothetical protein
MILGEVYNQFNQQLTTATALIRVSNVFFDNQVNFANENYSSDVHECVINGAFLMLFMAFEEFLENSFICYMVGQKGVNNKKLKSFVSPNSEEHAFNILKGLSKHPDFTNRDTIIILANNLFENGGSYTILNNFNVVFGELKKIRNAITHISIDSKNEFLNMARTKLGALPVGYNTAMFLNAFEPRTNLTFFIYYRDHIKYIVDNIANPT